MQHTMTISPNGATTLIYDDDLAVVARALGPVRIERASFVEPDEACQWWADMWPMLGPKLGPFDTRAAALAAEREWLENVL